MFGKNKYTYRNWLLRGYFTHCTNLEILKWKKGFYFLKKSLFLLGTYKKLKSRRKEFKYNSLEFKLDTELDKKIWILGLSHQVSWVIESHLIMDSFVLQSKMMIIIVVSPMWHLIHNISAFSRKSSWYTSFLFAISVLLEAMNRKEKRGEQFE